MSTTYDGFGSKSPQWWPSRYGVSDEAGGATNFYGRENKEKFTMPIALATPLAVV
jgi:hypothetical protein